MSEQVLPTQFRIHDEGGLAEKCKQRFIDAFNATWSRLPARDVERITIGIAQTRAKFVEIRLTDEHYSMSRGPTGDASAQFRYY